MQQLEHTPAPHCIIVYQISDQTSQETKHNHGGLSGKDIKSFLLKETNERSTGFFVLDWLFSYISQGTCSVLVDCAELDNAA